MSHSYNAYKYTFSTEGIISDHKNILAYILCISFAGDASVGPNGGYDLYLETIMKTWNELNSVEVPARGRSDSTEVHRLRNGLRNRQA
ncbi:hypothetical protein DL768_000648 [Monosporascus sp. mg162]|nr:hypothetical protein DL768_000648 [Monosporascus sp. mg162]